MPSVSVAQEIIIAVEDGDPLIREAGLWLDPHRPRDFAFVSHAHADHFAPHGRTLCSTQTRRLIEARYEGASADFLSLEFGEAAEIAPGWKAELLPAGHIAGSAMLHLTRLEDGATLLHTGDFKTRPAAGSETCQPRHADTLVMETTFGIPRFRLPPAEEVLAQIAKFARETLEEGEVPVFLAYSLGKAQEILIELHLRAPELEFLVHPSVAKMNEAVAALGYDLHECGLFEPSKDPPLGKTLVLPPNSVRSRAIRRIRQYVRLAMISGWGMDAGAKYRYQTDEVFPLSDHAGYDDLLAFVDEVKPSRVHTIHGYVDEFARDLRERGIEAWPLRAETQLEFSLAAAKPDQTGLGEQPNPAGRRPVESSYTDSEFGDFTAVCGEIAAVTGKLRKRKILAAYLRQLDERSLPLATTFLSGRAFPRESEVRAANVGWAAIRQALLDVAGLTLPQYRQISSSQADAARTTHLVLQGKTTPLPHSLPEVAKLFSELATTSGQTEKIRLLREALAGFHHTEAAYVVGILTGDLRIGLKEGLLEEAIADAFSRDPADVRRAHMLTGDLGKTAELARDDRLGDADATWFTPLKAMLASPEETAVDIVARLGGEGKAVWLEDKFDGIRAQLHREGDRVEIYSRDLRPVHAEFPELVEAARELGHDVILDGEIIAFAEGKKLTFFDLQKRLGRKGQTTAQGDLFLGEAIPVRFVAFDLLGIDGEGCLDRPLRERRALLEEVGLSGTLSACEVVFAETPEEVDTAFEASRARGNEGLIAKDPASPYSPGRRGRQWLKLKKVMPTLDVVVVKAQQGRGKRAHVLSDYTFAVRDERTGALATIGKAYSGLTDEEIEELTEHFRNRTIEKSRSVHTVEPDIVLEIAFDSIQASDRHDSGLAMRFPRIKAIRRDKTAGEIDTLEYAQTLVRT